MAQEEDLIKCYHCNKKLLQDRVIGGELVKMLSPDRVIVQFYLDNNSRMDIAMCKNCAAVDLNSVVIQNKIMNNIIDGWQIEQNILLERGLTTQEQADICMAYHRKLSILFRSDKMNDYQIKARLSQ